MAGRSTADRPPQGLDAHHLGVWRHAYRCLVEQESWAWEQAPLLSEYVHALQSAQEARDGFRWLERLVDHIERLTEGDADAVDWEALSRITGRLERIAAGLPVQWDRHAKRAAALADQLALTPRGRKAAGIGEQRDDEPQPADPFDEIDAHDEVGERRRARTG